MTDFVYRAVVRKVVDADTLDVTLLKPLKLIDLDFGFKFRVRLSVTLEHDVRVRLAEVNAWETRGAERARGLAAKQRVLELCPVGSEVELSTHKAGKFNRYVAKVTLSDDRDLGEVLLVEGHARPYGS